MPSARWRRAPAPPGGAPGHVEVHDHQRQRADRRLCHSQRSPSAMSRPDMGAHVPRACDGSRNRADQQRAEQHADQPGRRTAGQPDREQNAPIGGPASWLSSEEAGHQSGRWRSRGRAWRPASAAACWRGVDEHLGDPEREHRGQHDGHVDVAGDEERRAAPRGRRPGTGWRATIEQPPVDPVGDRAGVQPEEQPRHPLQQRRRARPGRRRASAKRPAAARRPARCRPRVGRSRSAASSVRNSRPSRAGTSRSTMLTRSRGYAPRRAPRHLPFGQATAGRRPRRRTTNVSASAPSTSAGRRGTGRSARRPGERSGAPVAGRVEAHAAGDVDAVDVEAADQVDGVDDVGVAAGLAAAGVVRRHPHRVPDLAGEPVGVAVGLDPLRVAHVDELDAAAVEADRDDAAGAVVEPVGRAERALRQREVAEVGELDLVERHDRRPGRRPVA